MSSDQMKCLDHYFPLNTCMRRKPSHLLENSFRAIFIIAIMRSPSTTLFMFHHYFGSFYLRRLSTLAFQNRVFSYYINCWAVTYDVPQTPKKFAINLKLQKDWNLFGVL